MSRNFALPRLAISGAYYKIKIFLRAIPFRQEISP
jgi:hypothetical protein